MQELIDSYILLKHVWKATQPLETCPDLVNSYPANARKFVSTLKEYFAYTKDNMPNYMHKILAHVPQLIEEFGSVGAFSSEPNEHGNKLFRLLRRMCARQQTNFELKDILKYHWLYTMKSLQQLTAAGQTGRKQKCSLCLELGHKRRTCPSKNAHRQL